jgi:hypothetical protein
MTTDSDGKGNGLIIRQRGAAVNLIPGKILPGGR